MRLERWSEGRELTRELKKKRRRKGKKCARRWSLYMGAEAGGAS
jgi:hypothetical protein